MTSYRQTVPIFFSTGIIKVVKKNSSFLDCVISWKDWDYPDTGMRVSTRSCLTSRIITGRQWQIPCNSRHLCILFQPRNQAWVEALISFVDNFTKDLTTSKFFYSKGLHVTSRLVKRILEEIFKPCQGVLKGFQDKRSTIKRLYHPMDKYTIPPTCFTTQEFQTKRLRNYGIRIGQVFNDQHCL